MKIIFRINIAVSLDVDSRLQLDLSVDEQLTLFIIQKLLQKFKETPSLHLYKTIVEKTSGNSHYSSTLEDSIEGTVTNDMMMKTELKLALNKQENSYHFQVYLRILAYEKDWNKLDLEIQKMKKLTVVATQLMSDHLSSLFPQQVITNSLDKIVNSLISYTPVLKKRYFIYIFYIHKN